MDVPPCRQGTLPITHCSGGILGGAVVRSLKSCSLNTVVPGVQADCVGQEGKPGQEEVGRLMIHAVYLGRDPGDPSALEHPQAVEGIRHTR
ncbi:hypothetical protein HRbin22_02483 [Candidatus Thermoflexus japonica]|uniref:Uncharacterized protein n=1 Tax=Candidatus Thermoflexus japonica TaxID=2035417 RepID=A0A2H5Y9T4_9CHLR|nr:hypothetical protein HRbin22_02483 [Candidatus Thermoflexus japonica]